MALAKGPMEYNQSLASASLLPSFGFQPFTASVAAAAAATAAAATAAAATAAAAAASAAAGLNLGYRCLRWNIFPHRIRIGIFHFLLPNFFFLPNAEITYNQGCSEDFLYCVVIA